MYKDRHAKVEMVCEWCGNTFYARVERVDKGQGRFCSLEHFNEYQKEEGKKTWGKENGKTYWDGSMWKLHYADEHGNRKVISYPKYLWEINYGEIPYKHLVSFKDGNPYNIDLDNLYLISRSELSAIQGRKHLGVPKPTIAGENSKWWRGGVSRNGGYGFEFSKSLKKRIKIRDGYMCQCCYFEFPSRNLQVHHKDRDIHNNDDSNLVTVCSSCHRAIHGTENKTNDKIRYYQSLLPD
jgi:hypothetical protein